MVVASVAFTSQAPAPHPPAVSAAPMSGATASDEAFLVAAIARGEIAALDQLYRRYRADAFALASALMRNPHAAEDVVQDAFLRAWRRAASYQPARGPVRSWLLAIVRHIAIDQLRARQVARRHQAVLIIDATRADREDDIALAIDSDSDARRVRDALAGLPAAQRHALELAFFAGLTHGEIAERTGLPLGTVKGRVRLGMRRLRHDLRELSWERADSGRPGARAT